MANTSLNHYSSTLNISIDTYDLLYELTNKSKALTQVALTGAFSENTAETVHHYLCILDDLLNGLKEKLAQITIKEKESKENQENNEDNITF
jgi:hypothetical protein